MKITVIGPTDLKTVKVGSDMGGWNIRERCADVGELLAERKDELHICPDSGIATLVAESYKKNGGRKVVAYTPKKDAKWGVGHLKPYMRLADKKVVLGSWDILPRKLMESSDVVVSMGLSAGTLWELCVCKWLIKFDKKKMRVFIFKDMISKLPRELEYELSKHIEYIHSIRELKSLLE